MLKIHANVFRLMTPRGWGAIMSLLTPFMASYVPRIMFISQPGPVWPALQPYVELLFLACLCALQPPPPLKTKWNHSEFPESSILSCLWALAQLMLFSCPGPHPNSHLSSGLSIDNSSLLPIHPGPPGQLPWDVLETSLKGRPGQRLLRTQGIIREGL